MPEPNRNGHAHTVDEGWRAKLHEVIFEADTPAGKAFDIVLLVAILLTSGAVYCKKCGPRL